MKLTKNELKRLGNAFLAASEDGNDLCYCPRGEVDYQEGVVKEARYTLDPDLFVAKQCRELMRAQDLPPVCWVKHHGNNSLVTFRDRTGIALGGNDQVMSVLYHSQTEHAWSSDLKVWHNFYGEEMACED